MNSPLPHPLKQEKRPQQVSFGKRELFWKRRSVHLGKSSFHLKRNERLPLLARQDRAPPAYRKKKRASKFMRKKKAPFTVDKKRLSFSLGQGKRSWLSSSTFSKDERRARAQEERLEPPPSLENRNPFTKKVSPSLHPSTTRRKSPSSYSWWTKSISF